jgi:flagellar biosynthesis chaperone FliJ
MTLPKSEHEPQSSQRESGMVIAKWMMEEGFLRVIKRTGEGCQDSFFSGTLRVEKMIKHWFTMDFEKAISQPRFPNNEYRFPIPEFPFPASVS